MITPRATASWTRRTVASTSRRTWALLNLLDRADELIDVVVSLHHPIQSIAENIAALTESASGINRNAGDIAAQIATLTHAAQGIDSSASSLATDAATIAGALPVVQRLTEIVDPLDHTVARLARLVDRIPGGKRASTRDGAVDGDRWSTNVMESR
ncbi:hypothetical protein GR927_24495 [Mycolicibacterium sp. 3033]|nr:hypothetical protein [Mycolicibacterium aurantiacum]